MPLKSVKKGCLYVVATPIGNLEDITLRAIRILKEVDFIAAENMRRAKVLLKHYGIDERKLISYRRENQKKVTPKIIEKLNSGYNIALISDAGTPSVSDPGAYLVSNALDSGIQVIPVPGPSSVTAAISVSGISSSGFLFVGFLPSKSSARIKKLNLLKEEEVPIIFFEAPHRLLDTLEDIRKVFDNRKIVLLKELTKIHEEIKRGYLDEIIDEISEKEIKGEYIIILFPKERKKEVSFDEDTIKEIDELIKEGLSTKDIAETISKKKGISYRKIYKKCLERKRIFDGVCEKA